MSADGQIKISRPIFEMGALERQISDRGYYAVCGVDEVGRGPLAGPVVAAAVIMPEDVVIDDLNDSKKLSPKRREIVFERIVEMELSCAIGIIDRENIDRMNIHKASLMAMRKAVMDLKRAPDFVLVDGTFLIPNISVPQLAVVKGDACCRSVAAASIVAKVTRDRIMERYETLYPSFSFSRHKGYPTPAHLEELAIHGPCEIHRRSFKPVADFIEQYELF